MMSPHNESTRAAPGSSSGSDSWLRNQAGRDGALSQLPELSSLQSFIDDLDAAWPAGAQVALTDSVSCSPQPGAASSTFGRFVLHETLGEGGFGIVFRAFDPALGREIALKLPRVEAWASAELRDRFLREGQAAATLSHPNILPVHEAGVVDGVGYIVSMLCAGPTLAQWIANSPTSCAPELAAWIVMCLARAVHHAHDRGVLHRDIKPSNVLLEPNPESRSGPTFVPRLTDFGLAKQLNNVARETTAHVQFGTPRYMAPEQIGIGGRADVGVFTDVYALGVVLYELLTGRLPFDSSDPLELARAIREAEPGRVRVARPEVTKDLETICSKCLQKRPEERYRSAAELGDDLQRYLAGEEVLARPLGWGTKWLRRCQRHKTVTALATAVLLSVVVGIAGIAHQWRSAHRYATAVEQSLVESEQGLVNMAWVFQEVNLWAESADPFQEGDREPLLKHYRRMLDRPLPLRPSPSYQATMESFRARVAELENSESEADLRFKKTIDLWTDLVQRDSNNELYKQALVLNLFSYGAHLRRYGHTDHPLAERRKERLLFSYLLGFDRAAGTIVRDYVRFLIDRGKTLMRLGQEREANNCFLFAQNLMQKSVEAFQKNIELQRLYARTFFYLACSNRRLGNRKEAIRLFHQTSSTLESAIAASSTETDDLMLRVETWRLLAACMRDSDRVDDALKMFETSKYFLLKLPREVAETPRAWNLLASVQSNLAELYESKAMPSDARLNWEQFCTTSQRSLDKGCALDRMTSKLPAVLYQLGLELQREGRRSEATSRFEKACAVMERVDTPYLTNSERQRIWSDCLKHLADLAEEANDPMRATELNKRATEVLQRSS